MRVMQLQVFAGRENNILTVLPNVSSSTQSAPIRKAQREFPLKVKFQHKSCFQICFLKIVYLLRLAREIVA